MTNSFLQRVLVPIANPDDAAATTAALAPYVDAADSLVTAVHIIEKAGGAPDKASVEQPELVAQDIFTTVTSGLTDTKATIETQILHGTDIAATLIGAAHDNNASAIVFTPRGASRRKKLLAGDVTHNLLNSGDIPILVFPRNIDDTGVENPEENNQPASRS